MIQPSSRTRGGRRSARLPGLAALALIGVLVTACQDQPSIVSGAGPSGGAGPSPVGAISVGLAVPPHFQIATVNYQIAKPGFSQGGALNVSQSGALTATVGGIPAGTGYTLTLTATDVGQNFTGCLGSSPVSVTAGAVTSVSVDIACRLPQKTVVTTPPPQVPVPLSAIALLAAALVAAGALRAGRRPKDRRPPRVI